MLDPLVVLPFVPIPVRPVAFSLAVGLAVLELAHIDFPGLVLVRPVMWHGMIIV